MNDDENTAPGVQPPACWLCRRPYTDHSPDCTERDWQAMVKAHRDAEVRNAGALLYFKALTRLQVILDLGIGARSRGAWFHYKGKIV